MELSIILIVYKIADIKNAGAGSPALLEQVPHAPAGAGSTRWSRFVTCSETFEFVGTPSTRGGVFIMI